MTARGLTDDGDRSITLKALREREAAQVPPRLGVRIVAVFVVLQILLLAALMLLFPATRRRRAGEGRRRGHDRGRLRPARVHARRGDRGRGAARQRHRDHRVQAAGRRAGRPHSDAGVGLCERGAARSRTARAVRLALNRKVTVNTMAAGEKLFVDLLPEGWTGLPPGLPQEVVEELARRAREAEKKARAQQRVTRSSARCRRCACASACSRPSRATPSACRR